MNGLPAALAETLRLLAAQVAQCAVDDWWIIGSTAVLLHGADLPDVRETGGAGGPNEEISSAEGD